MRIATSPYIVAEFSTARRICWRFTTVRISHLEIAAMALKVFSCCSYSTLFETRTREEWNALQFVRAIKGRPLRGYARVPLPDGTRAYLDQSTAASAPGWFAQMAAQRITWNRAGELALTPIPDAACDIASVAPPKTRVLADALAATLPPHKAAVLDVLRWHERMVPLTSASARAIRRSSIATCA